MSAFFWQGVLHPLIVPAHLMVLLALGLVLGQQAQASIQKALLGFAIILMVTLGLSRWFGQIQAAEFTLLTLAVILGLCIILQRSLQLPSLLTLSLISAGVIGLDSYVRSLPGLPLAKIYIQLLASGLSALLIVISVTVISFYLHKFKDGIAVRVIGAWVTAGSLMVLALLVHQALKR